MKECERKRLLIGLGRGLGCLCIFEVTAVKVLKSVAFRLVI